MNGTDSLALTNRLLEFKFKFVGVFKASVIVSYWILRQEIYEYSEKKTYIIGRPELHPDCVADLKFDVLHLCFEVAIERLIVVVIFPVI